MIRLNRPRRLLAIAAVATLALGGGAAAFWTGAGGGGAEASVGDPQPLSLEAGSPTAQLYPGGSATVSVVASNPNPYVVRIGHLVLDDGSGTGGFDVDAGHAGCDLTTLSFTDQDHGGAGWSVPPRTGTADGSLRIDLPGALAMGQDAANACQGATFTIHLEATA